jgi:Fur family ferric uptake transcriptional regulator
MIKEMTKAPHGIDAKAWLRLHGLRATDGRMAIVRLLDGSKVPLTLQEIHDRVGGKSCDFATVFRFVSILEEKGLVEKVAWMDGTTRHELKADDGHHHHYLICRTCHKVEPVDGCAVDRLEDQIAAKRGYTAINHSLQLSGVCPNCQKTESKSPSKNRKAG